jgi:hypothetical protein
MSGCDLVPAACSREASAYSTHLADPNAASESWYRYDDPETT